jgi:hypothetical protein
MQIRNRKVVGFITNKEIEIEKKANSLVCNILKVDSRPTSASDFLDNRTLFLFSVQLKEFSFVSLKTNKHYNLSQKYSLCAFLQHFAIIPIKNTVTRSFVFLL